MRKLEGKVALITGGGSGIGAAAARLFAQEGARIGVLDWNGVAAEAVAQEIREAGGEAIALAADISEAEQVRQAVETLTVQWETIHVLVANAGINGVWAPIDELEPEEWDRTMAVNLRGTFLTFKYAIPHLRKQGGAAVITSSVHGTRLINPPGATAYACTKTAQVTFAKKAALELRRDNIRVNVICPGGTESNINETTVFREIERIKIPKRYPEGRFPLEGRGHNKAEEVARLLLFLCSDDANRITGTEMWIDGGDTLL
jgi:NAD(P)-dependent dehydrogenase (short-subunit alcohol dehydrogenase family)